MGCFPTLARGFPERFESAAVDATDGHMLHCWEVLAFSEPGDHQAGHRLGHKSGPWSP